MARESRALSGLQPHLATIRGRLGCVDVPFPRIRLDGLDPRRRAACRAAERSCPRPRGLHPGLPRARRAAAGRPRRAETTEAPPHPPRRLLNHAHRPHPRSHPDCGPTGRRSRIRARHAARLARGGRAARAPTLAGARLIASARPAPRHSLRPLLAVLRTGRALCGDGRRTMGCAKSGPSFLSRAALEVDDVDTVALAPAAGSEALDLPVSSRPTTNRRRDPGTRAAPRRENPGWLYPRIAGELNGSHRVSATTVRKLLRQRGLRPVSERTGLCGRAFLLALPA